MSKAPYEKVLQWLTWQRILLVAFGCAVLVGIIVYLFVPLRYSASASVLVSKPVSAPAGLQGLQGLAQLGLGNEGASLERIQAILKSRRLRNDLIEKHDLESKLQLSHEETLEWLRENTSIKTLGPDFAGGGVGLTIRAHCTGSSRTDSWLGRTAAFNDAEAKEICAQLANDYVTFLDKYLTAANVKSAQGTKEFIQERLDTVRQNLEDAEDRLQQLRQHYLLMEPEEKAKALSSAIQDASTTYEKTSHTVQEFSQQLRETKETLGREEAERIASEVIARNPKITSLHEQLATVEAQLAVEQDDGKSSQHPDVRALQSKIRNIKQQLQQTQEDIRQQVVWQSNPLHDTLRDRAVELEAELAGLRARRESLHQEISEGEQQLREFPAIAREYMNAERQRQLYAEIAATLARQLELATIQVQKDTSDSFDVLDTAVPPERQTSPSASNSAAMAFIVVLAILALALMHRDGLFLDFREVPSQQTDEKNTK